MNLIELIDSIKNDQNFNIQPACGCPRLKEGHVLPEDLKEFYRICGGIECYIQDGGFPITILSPDKVKQANLLLLGEEFPEDRSSSWYVIADAGDGNYITIDFSKERLGKCYESFEYSHAVAGSCPVVALTFTELLQEIYEYSGDYFYWKDKIGFEPLGDAYDQ